jgi:outer membrane usher protein
VGAHGSRGSSGQLQVSRSARGIDDFGYRGQLDYDGEELIADARVQYDATVGRYAGTYRHVRERGVVSLEASGALVVVPKVGVFPTLPVQGAYGLIRTKGVGGVRGYGNNQEIARTNRAGHVVVPNLLPYYGNLLRIDPNDMPMEYSVEAHEMTLAPPPRGVALADFGVRVARYYRGRISVETNGERGVPKWGQVTVRQAGEDAVSPLGEEGEFDLDGVQPGTHNVMVEWEDGPCVFQVEFPDVDSSFIELGELVCSRVRQAQP